MVAQETRIKTRRSHVICVELSLNQSVELVGFTIRSEPLGVCSVVTNSDEGVGASQLFMLV